MNFTDAIKSAFNKYARFTGRATRSEYWYFVLFYVVVSFVVSLVDSNGAVSGLVGLALLVPWLSVAARRLHDTDRTGWWQLLGFIPLIGAIILIVWLATKGDALPNRYGEPVTPFPTVI